MYSNIHSSFVFHIFLMAVLRNCGFAPRIKIHHSDHSIDRSTSISRQFEQEFEPCRLVFKGSGKERSSSHYSVPAKKRQKFEMLK